MVHAPCARCAASAGWVSAAGNCLLALLKGSAALLCGSQALLADSLHSIVGALSSAIVLVSLKLAKREPTARYPYGFAKVEHVAALTGEVLVFLVGTLIVVNAIHTLLDGRVMTPELPALFVAPLSIAGNCAIGSFMSCAGRRSNSFSLIALGYENRAVAFSSAVALLGILGAAFGLETLDPIAAILIGVIVMQQAARHSYRAARCLTDAAVPRAERERIERVVLGVRYVEAVLGIKTRQLGRTAHADIDVAVDCDISIEAAGAVAEAVTEQVRARVPSLGSVHVYTYPAQHGFDVRGARLEQLLATLRDVRVPHAQR
jgi:cation diffusion facilitator family transporter